LTIAAEPKKKDERDESRRNSFLRLVPRIAKEASRGAFRIGIADDVFRQPFPEPAMPVESIHKNDLERPSKPQLSEKMDTAKPVRVETVLALAGAGLVLAYFFGRYSRK
jgi:hypothetical protein